MRFRAFSLIEMVVVLAISGILTGLAVVTLQDTSESMRERRAARGLASYLKRTRIMAINNHARVAIDTATSGVLIALSCPGQYGSTACAANTTPGEAVQGRFSFAPDHVGVNFTAPATQLEWSVSGLPVVDNTYTFTVDHPGSPGTSFVIVTTAGEIRVE